MSIKVKNLNGTGDAKCQCGSWINHWETFSQVKAGICKEVKCTNPATDGAHVQKTIANDNNWYIIPLCKEHNLLKGKEIEVVDSTTFIPANKKETCEK